MRHQPFAPFCLCLLFTSSLQKSDSLSQHSGLIQVSCTGSHPCPRTKPASYPPLTHVVSQLYYFNPSSYLTFAKGSPSITTLDLCHILQVGVQFSTCDYFAHLGNLVRSCLKIRSKEKLSGRALNLPLLALPLTAFQSQKISSPPSSPLSSPSCLRESRLSLNS